jgi:hypothetical protein
MIEHRIMPIIETAPEGHSGKCQSLIILNLALKTESDEERGEALEKGKISGY